jgi:hypothetical protein
MLTLIIYLVTSLLGKRRSMKLALFTSIVGLIVYWIANYLWTNTLVSAFLGGIAWLVALKTVYRMGWIKALIVAVGILIITYVVTAELSRALASL